MKKFLCRLILLGVCALPCFSAIAVEKREYVASPTPDALYFIEWQQVSGATLNVTNRESVMWSPMSVRVTWPAATTSTNTFQSIAQITSITYSNSVVTTNEVGTTVTNWLHGLIVAAQAYITNTLVLATNTASDSCEVDLSREYLQRADVLRVTCSDTNTRWVKIEARR